MTNKIVLLVLISYFIFACRRRVKEFSSDGSSHTNSLLSLCEVDGTQLGATKKLHLLLLLKWAITAVFLGFSDLT